MRKFKHPIAIFGIVTLVLVCVLKINVKPLVDNARERRYAHSANLTMTVGVVWPPATNKIERRYSYVAGAQYAVDSFIKTGRLKGICKGIRVKQIDEVNPQRDLIDGPIRNALADPSMAAIVGLASSVDAHRTAILTSDRHVFVLTSLATWPALTKHGFDHLFRLTPDDSATAHILSDFARSRGFKRVGIVYAMLPHGNAISPLLVEELAKQNVELAFLHAYAPNPDPTYPDVLGVIGPMMKRYGKIDALYMIDDLSANPKMIKYLRQAGVTVPILGSDSLDFPDIWREAGKAADGVCFVSSRSVPKGDVQIHRLYEQVVRPSDRDFVTIDRFSHYGFMSGYETMSLYLSAVQVSGTFYTRQTGIVLRNRTWDTLHGRIQFTSDGDAIGQKLYVNEIVNGQPHMVFSETDTDEELQ